MSTQAQMVYLGRRYSKRMEHHIAPLDALDDVKVYTAHAGMRAVGGIYTCTFDDDGALFVKGDQAPRYTCLHDDERRRAAWVLEDKAAADVELTVKRERDAARRSALDELLEPLRLQYQGTNHATRKAMEIEVLASLRRRVTS